MYIYPFVSLQGPHSLACAANNLNNMKCCAVVSPDVPYNLLGMTEKMYGTSSLSKEDSLKRAMHTYSDLEAQYKKMKKVHRRDMALKDLSVATEQGLEGPSSDAVLETNPWGFDVKDISLPTYLWFGRDDDLIPLDGILYLLANIGNLQKSVIVGSENHTMIRRYWFEIMSTMVNHPERNDGKL